MSQPVLLALGTITIALFLTVAIASAAFSDEDTFRAMKVMVVGAAIAAAAVTIEDAHLRVNFTASMPLGIYQLKPVPPGGIARGMTVAACPPFEAARLGRSRGYLAPGPCPGGSEPLLKLVAGVPGDRIDVLTAGVNVDGCRLPDSAPVAADNSGRRLRAWTPGGYRLAAGQVWLYAPNARSWDSRYWGPAAAADVLAFAVPLLTASAAFRSTSGEPGCGAARSAGPASSPG